ncbi:carotenoid biosynthesis protein [Micromonospora chokoriensis]
MSAQIQQIEAGDRRVRRLRPTRTVLVVMWIAVGVDAIVNLIPLPLAGSVVTGVPFGHYHYTDELGAKLIEVPVLIGPAYFAVSYMAWCIATILFRPVHRGSPVGAVIGTPLVASFTMVAWDLALDPSSSTLRGRWEWEDGGGAATWRYRSSPTSWWPAITSSPG